MNEIANKCLLAGDRFMFEMHRLLKIKKEWKTLKKHEIQKILYGVTATGLEPRTT